MATAWFSALFGFDEGSSFSGTRGKFAMVDGPEGPNTVLQCPSSKREFFVGPFSVNSVAELRNRMERARAAAAAAAATATACATFLALRDTKSPGPGGSGRESDLERAADGDAERVDVGADGVLDAVDATLLRVASGVAFDGVAVADAVSLGDSARRPHMFAARVVEPDSCAKARCVSACQRLQPKCHVLVP